MEAYNDKLPRQQLQIIVCENCQHLQHMSKGDTCLECGTVFAAYSNHQELLHAQVRCLECNSRLRIALSGNAEGSYSSSSSSSSVKNLMGQLQGSFQPGEAAEVEAMLRELQDAGGLRGMLLNGGIMTLESDWGSHTSLNTHPRQFRQCLERALLESVLITEAERAAKGKAIDSVVRLLHQAGSRGDLMVAGKCFSIDRFAVAGSAGKNVSVQDAFDIDLVAFLNVPERLEAIDMVNPISLGWPDSTQDSVWMQQLQQQVVSCLQKPGALPGLVGKVRVGRVAITLTLSVQVPGSAQGVELDVDVLLAPNLAAGKGAAAAAKMGVLSGEPAEVQCKVVLAPVLAFADQLLGKVDGIIGKLAGLGLLPVELEPDRTVSAYIMPSYARNIWLTEAATEFVQQAAAAGSKGLSGRVVTSTIRIVKAWVKRGLQPQRPGFKKLKSFMLELFVLHAAQTFGSRPHIRSSSSSSSSGGGCSPQGGYVLDLLLETLAVMIEWANAAEPSTAGSSAAAYPAPQEPVLFNQMVADKYYSAEQALALRRLVEDKSWPDEFGLRTAKPVVVHPVDPFSSVFAQEAGRRFELWKELRQEAQLLLKQLKQCSWGEVMRGSTLGRALSLIV